MEVLKLEATVSVAEVIALAVLRVLEESLPPALVLAPQCAQVDHLIGRVLALEHVDPCLIVGPNRAERVVSFVWRVVDKLLFLPRAIQRLATGKHQDLSLAISGAAVKVEIPGTLVLDYGLWRGRGYGAVVEEGAVLRIGEVSFAGAGEGD